MKTELEIVDGNMVISTVDGAFSITLDVATGEVIEFNYTEATLQKLSQFINKVKTRYNKFMSSKEAEDFIL